MIRVDGFVGASIIGSASSVSGASSVGASSVGGCGLFCHGLVSLRVRFWMLYVSCCVG